MKKIENVKSWNNLREAFIEACEEVETLREDLYLMSMIAVLELVALIVIPFVVR